MSEARRKIRSGELGEMSLAQDYRSEELGSMMVERVIWGEVPEPVRKHGVIVAERDWIWFRFWLFESQQVVEKYYSGDGVLMGTHIDVCLPFDNTQGRYSAVDTFLDLWIDPTGHVTVYDEARFEEAIATGALKPEEVDHAEQHFRTLTAGIARNRFPPAIVRNWQVDVRHDSPVREVSE